MKSDGRHTTPPPPTPTTTAIASSSHQIKSVSKSKVADHNHHHLQQQSQQPSEDQNLLAPFRHRRRDKVGGTMSWIYHSVFHRGIDGDSTIVTDDTNTGILDERVVGSLGTTTDCFEDDLPQRSRNEVLPSYTDTRRQNGRTIGFCCRYRMMVVIGCAMVAALVINASIRNNQRDDGAYDGDSGSNDPVSPSSIDSKGASEEETDLLLHLPSNPSHPTTTTTTAQHNPGDTPDGTNTSPVTQYLTGQDSDYAYYSSSNSTCSSTKSTVQDLLESSTVTSVPNGAVAADDVRCSEMGVAILRDYGGNAVDAAVTTTLCLGLVNPASSGLGGGAFILVHMESTAGAGAKAGGANGNTGDGTGYGYTTDVDDQRTFSSTTTNTTTNNNKIKGITEVIDCRETAPLASTTNMFQNLPPLSSLIGPLAIAVPGELRGLASVHERYGSIPWADVLRPVVELAERTEGIRVSRHLAGDIRDHRDTIEKYPLMKRLLTRPANQNGNDSSNTNNGEERVYLREGDALHRPKYAATLRSVMIHGPNHIYTGPVAETLASELQSMGAILSPDDFRTYRPVLRTPVSAGVFGNSNSDKNEYEIEVVGVPPPSSGGAAIIGVLRFLSGYGGPVAVAGGDTLGTHRFVEACRHVFAMRMSLADPGFDVGDAGGGTVARCVKDLVDGEYMEELRLRTRDDGVLGLEEYGGERWSLINGTDGSSSDVGGGVGDHHEGDRRKKRKKRKLGSEEANSAQRRTRRMNYLEDQGTTHLSVVDKNRNAVAITSSVNSYFGSMIVSPSTGIIFNGVMDDFATPGRPNYFGLHPSESNYIKPGKRPLSSMSPTLVFHRSGNLLLALGSSGGPKIITAVLQVILNHLVLGMSPFRSVLHPRVHDQLLYHGAALTGYDSCPLQAYDNGRGANVEAASMMATAAVVIETSARTREALKRRGHELIALDYLGTCQVVAVDREMDRLTAVSDVRKGGYSAGY